MIGRLLYGRKFGFMEKREDVGDYIESVDKALPLLNFVAVGPKYARPWVMMAALFLPGTLKSLNSVTGLQAEARRIIEERADEFAKNDSGEKDILSQLLKIIREQGDEKNFSNNELVLEAWVGL